MKKIIIILFVFVGFFSCQVTPVKIRHDSFKDQHVITGKVWSPTLESGYSRATIDLVKYFKGNSLSPVTITTTCTENGGLFGVSGNKPGISNFGILKINNKKFNIPIFNRINKNVTVNRVNFNTGMNTSYTKRVHTGSFLIPVEVTNLIKPEDKVQIRLYNGTDSITISLVPLVVKEIVKFIKIKPDPQKKYPSIHEVQDDGDISKEDW